MKLSPLIRLIGIYFLLLGSLVNLSAQKLPSGVSFKRLFLDYQTLQGGDFGAFIDYTDGFEFGYHHPITDHLYLNIPIKVGLGNKTEEITNNHILGIDGQLHLYLIKNPNLFKPYLLAGAGAVWQNMDSVNFQAPAGIGVDIKIAKYAYFNLQSEFRWSSAENNNNFNHGIGFKYFFGKNEPDTVALVDTDMDGIVDDFDACPTIPGLAAFAGCPDTDGDGIRDSLDACPYVAGLAEYKGCPDSDADGLPDNIDLCPSVAGPLTNQGCPLIDTDGDGITDVEDNCPTVRGSAAFKGCPDTDGDGIEDAKDKCPNIAGPATFMGCPDTDNDGIEDAKDKCPHTYGPVSNFGCPVIEAADREVLSFAMKAVQFELGKATLKTESFAVLNQIAGIMKKYPDYYLSIEGHTDNTGSNEINQKLSTNRAKSCYEYLIQKGIPADHMSYKGFGQSRPIADNSTYSGRTLNRRVEFNLAPGN